MDGSEAPAVSLNHPQTVNLNVDLRIFNKVITDGRLIVCQRWLLCDVPYYVVRNKSQHGHLTDEWWIEPWIQANLSLWPVVETCLCKQERRHSLKSEQLTNSGANPRLYLSENPRPVRNSIYFLIWFLCCGSWWRPELCSGSTPLIGYYLLLDSIQQQ